MFLSGHFIGFFSGHRALGHCTSEELGTSKEGNEREITDSQYDRSEGVWGPRRLLESTMRLSFQAAWGCSEKAVIRRDGAEPAAKATVGAEPKKLSAARFGGTFAVWWEKL